MANVWITKCRKTSKCRHCGLPITLHSHMVTVLFYYTAAAGARWTRVLHFHPQCWVDQGVAKADLQKPVAELRGRKSLGISPEQRTERNRLMCRRSSLIYRLNKEMEKPHYEVDIDKLVHFGSMLNELKESVEHLGGVPKSWNI